MFEIYRLKLEESKNKSACNIIHAHHDLLKDDPDHLTTEFLQKIIKIDCEEEA